MELNCPESGGLISPSLSYRQGSGLGLPDTPHLLLQQWASVATEARWQGGELFSSLPPLPLGGLQLGLPALTTTEQQNMPPSILSTGRLKEGE